MCSSLIAKEVTESLLNVQRMASRIEKLSHISSGQGPGVTRLAYTESDERATQLVEEWMIAAGMVITRDQFHNVIGRYEGIDVSAAPVVVGSHIDSVPEGGAYDGVLGVLAGIEVVQELSTRGMRCIRPIHVMIFRDEEGVRFQAGLIGSKGFTGLLTEQDLQLQDEKGITLAEAIAALGEDESISTVIVKQPNIASYVELHIEQGPLLDEYKIPCSVVNGIAGAARYRFKVVGNPGHAGTVPMALRKDALLAAAEIILAIEQQAILHDSLVATVGHLSVLPGASNVIPGVVEGSLDIRSLDEQLIKSSIATIIQVCEQICRLRGVDVSFTCVGYSPPVQASKRMISLIESVLAQHKITALPLVSGAGHDAMVMGAITEMGMIFVRCKEGISHHPAEYVDISDMEVALDVLFGVIYQLANDF